MRNLNGFTLAPYRATDDMQRQAATMIADGLECGMVASPGDVWGAMAAAAPKLTPDQVDHLLIKWHSASGETLPWWWKRDKRGGWLWKEHSGDFERNRDRRQFAAFLSSIQEG